MVGNIEYQNKVDSIVKNPDMFKIITEDEFDKTIVGELSSRKTIFLLNCSIWLKGIVEHTFIGGESSVGKDHVTKAVLKIFPQERVIFATKITPQAFTYWHENDKDWYWDNKIVYLPDIHESTLNSPVFKTMASEGTKAVVVRNGKTEEIEINGIPNLIVTTAESEPINEVLNRFNLVSLDETNKQTLAIMEFEAEKAKYNKKIFYSAEVVDALRMLEVVEVVVPFADKMIKYFPRNVKLRRIFKNFINLIKSSCALYQFQRDKDNDGNVIANKQDYEIAREVIENIREETISGVTAREKRYLMAFNNLPEKWYTLPEIFNETKGILTLQNWYKVMESLQEKGRVNLKEEKEDEMFGKWIKKYQKIIQEEIKLQLPAFEKLGFNDIISINDNNSIIDINKTILKKKENKGGIGVVLGH